MNYKMDNLVVMDGQDDPFLNLEEILAKKAADMQALQALMISELAFF
jgi:hypothetical protein